MTEQTNPEPTEGSNSDVPVYAEPQPVPAGVQSTVTEVESDEDFGIPPVEEQTGPPPLVEDLRDTNDLPEGFDLPSQSTEPDFELDDTEEETN